MQNYADGELIALRVTPCVSPFVPAPSQFKSNTAGTVWGLAL